MKNSINCNRIIRKKSYKGRDSNIVLELPFNNEADNKYSDIENLIHMPSGTEQKQSQSHIEDFIRVPLNIRFHGFNYTQICRGVRSCVYHQTLNQETVGYEVSIIHKEPETTLYGKCYPAHERWPRDGDWGKTAWSCFTLEEAMVKYNKLEISQTVYGPQSIVSNYEKPEVVAEKEQFAIDAASLKPI